MCNPGHRVSRPRGTGSVGDSVGEGTHATKLEDLESPVPRAHVAIGGGEQRGAAGEGGATQESARGEESKQKRKQREALTAKLNRCPTPPVRTPVRLVAPRLHYRLLTLCLSLIHI